MVINLEELYRLRDEKLVTIQNHPEYPEVSIANYSKVASYTRLWNEFPLLKECRGLVFYNTTGEVLAKPFTKFWNYGEDLSGISIEEIASWTDIEITTKYDGSCGIGLFVGPFAKKNAISTRGSFSSDQAIEGTKIWNEKVLIGKTNPKYTYLFEIIYPENRIVVDYGARRDLVLIGLVETSSGKELPYDDMANEASRLRLTIAEKSPITIQGAREYRAKGTDFEGFVLFSPSHQKRVKIKLEDYCALHRIVFRLSEKYLHEVYSSGKSIDKILESIPDVYKSWSRGILHSIEHKEINLITVILLAKYLLQNKSRKEAAAEVQTRIKNKQLWPAIFKSLDGKDYMHIIHKLSAPEGLGRTPVLTNNETE